MQENALSSPNLLGFIWANRRSFRTGLAYATGRIIAVAPFPIIFKHIIDHEMPQKNLTGIMWLSALMVVLLVAHQWLMVCVYRLHPVETGPAKSLSE